jgi:hypothetical protein
VSDPKWIRFREQGSSPSGKTRRWTVLPTHEVGLPLGSVSWYAPWRCYAFSPTLAGASVFERRCLRDIANFLEDQTIEHLSRGKVRT